MRNLFLDRRVLKPRRNVGSAKKGCEGHQKSEKHYKELGRETKISALVGWKIIK